MNESEDPSYPPEVQCVVDQLLRLRGVTAVSCDICALEDVRAENLSNFAYAKLPHGTLRRTNGGRKDEGMLQIEIRASRDEDGWRAVEFLAWFFRDLARAGDTNEFRPFALPPRAGFEVQSGRTLVFLAELFETDPAEGAPLRRMSALADDLLRTIDLCDDGPLKRGDPGLTRRDS